MATELLEWNTAGLLDYFLRVEREIGNRQFAFVLGAGASATSGIPTGYELVMTWLRELQRQLDPHHERRAVEEWATAASLDIAGFEFARAAEFYPEIFDMRFRGDPEEGYAALEAVMANKEPSIGYSVLAYIMSQTRHKVVITTNFDNLVANALTIFTSDYPLVCGHESLTGFIHPHMRRPLVAKIHRDLMLGPINDVEAVARLQKGWEPVLRDLFGVYTPIMIGYGGNDGSLMGLLDSLRPGEIAGRLFWCYRQQGGAPNERIRQLVGKHRGALVPILGFDEFMLQLADKLGFELLDDKIEEQARERANRYRQAFIGIRLRLGAPAESHEEEKATADVREAIDAAIKRKIDQPKNWWGFELKARSEEDPERREQTYREGLEQFPRSAELATNLATLLAKRRPAEAEQFFRMALELDPQDARHAGNLASFLHAAGKNAGEADKLFLLAVEQDPSNVFLLVQFAGFVARVRKAPEAAERLFKRALDLDAHDTVANGHYARFLAHVRKDNAGAERHFERTRGGEGKAFDPYFAAQHAAFLAEGGRNLGEAERLFREVLEVYPEDPTANVLHASFLLATGHGAPGTAANKSGPAREALSHAFRTRLWPPPLHAEATFLRALSQRMEGKDDRAALARLKALFARGFGRDWWFCGDLLAAAKKKLPSDHAALYQALADAILDEAHVEELDRFPRWDEIAQLAAPLSLDEPWPIDGTPGTPRIAVV